MGRGTVDLSGLDGIEAPVPAHVRPMLATLSEMPEHQPEFGFEYKWDGIRAVTFFDGNRLRVETRNLLDVTSGYPELAGLADEAGRASFVLDGEIVAFDGKGRPSFGRLQHRLGLTEARASARRAEIPVTYMIFDVLYLDGYRLTGLPYSERRAVLESIELSGPNWRVPPYFEGEGGAVLEAARENALEGVMAKRLTGPYVEGLRSRDWRKIKLVGRQEFVIGGWTRISTGAEAVGALLLGYYGDALEGSRARLHYAGRVGTGFSEGDRVALARALEAKERRTSPFGDRVDGRGIRFVDPEMVAEVEYRGWTGAGHLRQPSFKGLRPDKDPFEVVKEEPVD